MGELLNNLMKIELSLSGAPKKGAGNTTEGSIPRKDKNNPKKAAKPAAKFKKNKFARAGKKYCDRCGTNGFESQAQTHKSQDCKRFGADGKALKTFRPRSEQAPGKAAYAQMVQELAGFKERAKKDKKSLKKLKKKSKRKKRSSDSSDSDSDSS